MADIDPRRTPDDEQPDSRLVDIFDEENTRRFSAEELRDAAAGKEPEGEEIELEERDYRPVRVRRSGRRADVRCFHHLHLRHFGMRRLDGGMRRACAQ